MHVTTFLAVLSLAAVPCLADLKFVPKIVTRLGKFAEEKLASLGNEKDTAGKGYTTPAFCNKLDCPRFKVLTKTKDYELREYAPSNWATTELLNIDFMAAQYTMFMRLFKYISGANVRQEKIAMTVPVLFRIIPGQGPACENNFTMSFYVAPKVANPPQATDKTVTLTKMPIMRAYARSFPGFAKESDWVDEAKKLAASLPASAKYEKSYFYTAGYDAPFKLFKRHNEVWFLAK